MPNALTLADMSPGLRKVVGRESPRATSAEEPDAGNPLVRIWRGAGTGNLPAYSTTTFLRRPPASGSHAPRTVAPAVRPGARRSAGLRSLDMPLKMGERRAIRGALGRRPRERRLPAGGRDAN